MVSAAQPAPDEVATPVPHKPADDFRSSSLENATTTDAVVSSDVGLTEPTSDSDADGIGSSGNDPGLTDTSQDSKHPKSQDKVDIGVTGNRGSLKRPPVSRNVTATKSSTLKKTTTTKNAAGNMTVEAETVVSVPSVAVANGDLPQNQPEETRLESPAETEENDGILSDVHTTGEDYFGQHIEEQLPTGMQTPLNTIPSNAILSGSNVIKMKKSVDNGVTSAPGTTNYSSKRQKKKKSARVGGTSKAEIFAARIARAVDEVDSSDSEETFVYDSKNPQTEINTNPSGGSRFISRNMSASSLSVAGGESTPALAACNPTAMSPLLLPGAPHDGRRQGSATTESASDIDHATITTPRLLQPKTSNASLSRKITPLSPRGRPVATSNGSFTGLMKPSNKNSIKNSSINSNNRFPLPNLRGKPSRMFAIAAANNNMNSNYGTTNVQSDGSMNAKNSRRWRKSSSMSGYMDEDDDDDAAEGDIDDDDYMEFTERTPLRSGVMHGSESPSRRPSGGVSGGTGYGGTATEGLLSAGRSARLSRKNGGIIVYSPHNYQQQRSQADQRFHYVRMMLWMTFLAVFIVGFGFTMGFLFATSKPLTDVQFLKVFDVLASDDELAFEIVMEAYNPGLLAVSVEKVDLDVFAKSPYIDESDKHRWYGGIGGDDAASHIMKLGNIKSFDVPLVFEGNFFNRHPGKAIGDLKVLEPGLNSTVEEDVDLDDKPEDEGKKRWARVAVHPFDLTVRGVIKYELFMGRWKSKSVSKTVRVDPNNKGETKTGKIVGDEGEKMGYFVSDLEGEQKGFVEDGMRNGMGDEVWRRGADDGGIR